MKVTRRKSIEDKRKINEKLEKSSRVFMLLGLVLSLFVVYVFIEYETKQVKFRLSEPQKASIKPIVSNFYFRKEVPVTKSNELVKSENILKNDVSIVEIVPDEILDPVVITPKFKAEPAMNLDSIQVISIPDDIIEDVPFVLVEDAPVFPGCEKGSKDDKKACFSIKISKHINRKFNAGLASELGLSPGKIRIFVMFKIDKSGSVTDIQVKAPHPRLQKEAERVVKTIPKMIPGKQRGRAVGVGYTLPVSFIVE